MHRIPAFLLIVLSACGGEQPRASRETVPPEPAGQQPAAEAAVQVAAPDTLARAAALDTARAVDRPSPVAGDSIRVGIVGRVGDTLRAQTLPAIVQECRGEAGAAFAMAYSIALTYPDSLPAMVGNGPALFGERGPVVRCGRVVLKRLAGDPGLAPAPTTVERRASAVADSSGKAGLAPVISRQILGAREDPTRQVWLLESLVAVLPALAEGDYKTYLSSDIYQSSHFVWSNEAQLGIETDPSVRPLASELARWYMRALMTEARAGSR